ncbi:MAG: bifunctional DNA-formamidopyrimidine glycosylase/DNA-(apurinic or apyrimidinic site) lyase [Planctomycetota bacterium]
MPELPEVETMRRGVLSTIGAKIVAAEVPPCRCRPILMEPGIKALNRRVVGRKVSSIGRRGKRVLIHLDDEQTIVIEPRMTGLVLLADPPDPDHVRLQLTLDDGPSEQLLFWDRRGLGTVRLMTPRQFKAQVDERLGVDALTIGWQQLRESLRTSRRAIKVALLDQKAVAGIGNLYAAEILFDAGVDPRTRCDKLSGPQWRRIHWQMGQVLNEAIRHEGSTLSDGTYRNALNDPGGYQNQHRVYDRAGLPCPRCEHADIRRIVQAQRSTFFCPACQRRSGRHAAVQEC